MEVMGRDRYLHSKIVFSYSSPSFHFLYSSLSFSPLFLFLLIFFPSFFLSSSFHIVFSFSSSLLSSFWIL